MPLKPYLVQPVADDVTMGSCKQQTIPASGGRTIGQTENFFNYTAFRSTLSAIDENTARNLPAYVAEETVTTLDNQFCSTGSWKAAQTIQPFTAFLLPGGDGTFTLKLKDSGMLVLNDYSDNMPLITRYNGKTVESAILKNRTLWKDGSWNTLCLPFSLPSLEGTPLQGAVVKTLTTSTFKDATLQLNFSDNLSAIEAGKSYMVKWVKADDTEQMEGTGNIESPVFKNVTVSSDIIANSTTYADFVGAFSPVTLIAGDRTVLYMGSDNKLYYPATNVTVGACRAHFLLNGIMAGVNVGDVNIFVMNFNDEEITAITNPLQDSKGDGAWYSLDGRHLSGKPVGKGVYINNGKKVVVK